MAFLFNRDVNLMFYDIALKKIKKKKNLLNYVGLNTPANTNHARKVLDTRLKS